MAQQDKGSISKRRRIVDRFTKAQDRLVLQASDLSLETIASMVDSGAIDIEPGYQRRARWDDSKKAALIESFLLNVPIPSVYLAEEDYGTYSVIDGKQRITAIHEFMRNDLRLHDLETFTEVNGSRFDGLPRELQNALQVRPYLRAVTLLKQSDPELKYEVFSRLNTGGVALNAQELRNVAFRGDMNDLIYELATHGFLCRQLKIRGEKSPAYRDMTDAEFVLRFLTLKDSWDSFSGNLRKSMDDYVRENRNPSPQVLSSARRSFERSIVACKDIWGTHAFHRPVGNGWREQALAGVYDAQMVAVARLTDAQLKRVLQLRRRALRVTRELFEDREFEQAVRVGTNTPSRVRYRVEKLTEALQDIG